MHYVPTERNPTEADMVTAFEGQRSHTTTSEPYFWEQSSKPLSVSMAIPIDAAGQAHVYKLIQSLKRQVQGHGSVTVTFVA